MICSIFFFQLIDRIVSQTSKGFINIISPVDGTVITNVAAPSSFLNRHSVDTPAISSSSERRDTIEGLASVECLLNEPLADSVYSLPFETVFALYGSKTLVKASTLTNPAKIKKIWNYDEGMKLLFDNNLQPCLNLQFFGISPSIYQTYFQYVVNFATLNNSLFETS